MHFVERVDNQRHLGFPGTLRDLSARPGEMGDCRPSARLSREKLKTSSDEVISKAVRTDETGRLGISACGLNDLVGRP